MSRPGTVACPMTSGAADEILRRVVRVVAALNLAYFGIEFAVARLGGGVR